MTNPTRKSSIGVIAALSIGVGAMVGAGIFSVLGVLAGLAGSATLISFV
jgi:APA family basic amino acid/polyamine antiporter